MKITKRDLETKQERVNSLLRKIKVRVGYRYGYTAIDIIRNGNVYETLIAGLTKREAYDILDCIEEIMFLEGGKPNGGNIQNG
jgi:hypothetical protein